MYEKCHRANELYTLLESNDQQGHKIFHFSYYIHPPVYHMTL